MSNDSNMTDISCNSKSLRDTPLFSLSFSEGDPNTFTCLVLWLTVNSKNTVKVKCMDHSEYKGFAMYGVVFLCSKYEVVTG